MITPYEKYKANLHRLEKSLGKIENRLQALDDLSEWTEKQRVEYENLDMEWEDINVTIRTLKATGE